MYTTKQLLNMAESRKNLQAFLHFSDIQKIAELVGVNVDKLSFVTAIDAVMKSSASASKKKQALEIIVLSNDQVKTERYRLDGNKIFEYSQAHKAYLFCCSGGSRTLKKLEKENGKYLD